MTDKRLLALAGIVLAAALMRLVPHPWNMTPVAAMALFGGAAFADRRLAFLLPLAAMALSDLALGLIHGTGWFHTTLPFVYGAFALTVLLGMALNKNRGVLPVAAATLGASLLFFLLTNFGTWATGDLYPATPGGLLACYVAALPFFVNTLVGNAFYATLLFGGLAFAERRSVIARVRA